MLLPCPSSPAHSHSIPYSISPNRFWYPLVRSSHKSKLSLCKAHTLFQEILLFLRMRFILTYLRAISSRNVVVNCNAFSVNLKKTFFFLHSLNKAVDFPFRCDYYSYCGSKCCCKYW